MNIDYCAVLVHVVTVVVSPKLSHASVAVEQQNARNFLPNEGCKDLVAGNS